MHEHSVHLFGSTRHCKQKDNIATDMQTTTTLKACMRISDAGKVSTHFRLHCPPILPFSPLISLHYSPSFLSFSSSLSVISHPTAI